MQTLISARLRLTDSPEALMELAEERRFGDGLPLIPPTEDRVARMILRAKCDSQTLVGRVAPDGGEATVEKIAINAVMAGCRPEHLPVLVAAVKAMTRAEFNLGAIQSTTNPVAPLMIINGPIRKALNVNCSSGAFGPCWRANATLGRAVRLILLNIGGASPGDVDKATQGQPAKYGFCVAENEEESPWGPLHVDRSFARKDSCVTMVSVTGTTNIVHVADTTAEGLLTQIANSTKAPGAPAFGQGKGPSVVAINPDHARVIAKSGFTKRDAQVFLHEKARVPAEWFDRAHLEWIKAGGKNSPDENGLYKQSRGPEDFLFVTVGGMQGGHTTYLPSFAAGGVEAITERIDLP